MGYKILIAVLSTLLDIKNFQSGVKADTYVKKDCPYENTQFCAVDDKACRPDISAKGYECFCDFPFVEEDGLCRYEPKASHFNVKIELSDVKWNNETENKQSGEYIRIRQELEDLVRDVTKLSTVVVDNIYREESSSFTESISSFFSLREGKIKAEIRISSVKMSEDGLREAFKLRCSNLCKTKTFSMGMDVIQIERIDKSPCTTCSENQTCNLSGKTLCSCRQNNTLCRDIPHYSRLSEIKTRMSRQVSDTSSTSTSTTTASTTGATSTETSTTSTPTTTASTTTGVTSTETSTTSTPTTTASTTTGVTSTETSTTPTPTTTASTTGVTSTETSTTPTPTTTASTTTGVTSTETSTTSTPTTTASTTGVTSTETSTTSTPTTTASTTTGVTSTVTSTTSTPTTTASTTTGVTSTETSTTATPTTTASTTGTTSTVSDTSTTSTPTTTASTTGVTSTTSSTSTPTTTTSTSTVLTSTTTSTVISTAPSTPLPGCSQDICRSGGDISSVCLNTGCNCTVGFLVDARNVCEDINECSSDPCGIQGDCINTVGSYSCLCGTGLQLLNGVCTETTGLLERIRSAILNVFQFILIAPFVLLLVFIQLPISIFYFFQNNIGKKRTFDDSILRTDQERQFANLIIKLSNEEALARAFSRLVGKKS